MDKRIYIQDWLKLKPYKKQTVTDTYYLKICNEVKKTIAISKEYFIFTMYISDEDIDTLACFLTAYFEDLISETNIWNSFIRTHKRLYKKQLPFYSLEEYFDEEINPQDISFLIWYFLNTVQEEMYITPLSDFIIETAGKVMAVFDKAWDQAPENDHLKTFYQIDENEADFYIARHLIDRILFKTYLFYPDTFQKLRDQELEIVKGSAEDKDIFMHLNENRDSTLHNSHTRLLSLKGKEWAAEILGHNHPLSSDFLNISQRIRGFFLYKGQDGKNIFIEHIASGKKFELTKKSFDNSDTLKELNTILFMGIVQWKNEWWFSGVFFQQAFNPDLVSNQKNSLESRIAVNFLDHHGKETEETLKMQLNAFKDFNEGSQIAFMPSEEIEDFVTDYAEFFNNSLKLSDKEKEEARQRASEEGLFDKEEEPRNISEISEAGLVFFNPKSGVEVALAVNSAFPLPNNPFFNEEDSEEDVLGLLMSEQMSAELAIYCIDNCKENLPFFNEETGKAYLKAIDFLLRFFKKNNYYPKPSITFTGTA
ncbi:MAG: DUF3843 family protein [Bacteroidales bacterium]|nr:DUF3843 family protein [Bacteroidales bacterium]